ncbi:ABC-2 type transport system permease protein [Herbihabitans rhizosphaerae]|uniref:ABC-2 type transport system permease protein n=1 Tax=Herbihabitans rhizosphaerae TaxID=1872711 RepID=A0A4Q7L941_9PSEU|nr:ABC transporter permease [Herbihabitans rhizosphaerae]RZS45201.1 ABC-2 type transport system permease protein [Herbihabitans rhizosphaerae]
MNHTANAVRAGLARGWIELKQTATNGQDIFGNLLTPVILLIVMLSMRGDTLAGFPLSQAVFALPGVIGMNIMISGLMDIAGRLAVEREDGTLLRAKALPSGMVGYMVGKVVTVSGSALVVAAAIIVPGAFLFDGLRLDAGAWLGLLGILVLGLLATMPLGAIAGSFLTNPRAVGALMLPIAGLAAISGIFAPITLFPEWLQWIGQVFPMYWLGLGVRSALLPDAAVAIEIGESWRQLETVAVLGVWAVIGLVVAPVVLRRMARRESGAAVAQRRHKAMQRIT